VLIRIQPTSSQAALSEYLLRLGCTVTPLDETTLAVCVPYPERDETEQSSLDAWCRAWAESDRRSGVMLEIAPAE
jgi:hypothetical protein